MRDLIDERNYRERVSNSIIKSYNVHYMSEEEQAEEAARKLIEQMKREEEEKRRRTIEQAVEIRSRKEYTHQQDNLDDNPLTKEQIEKILGERDDRIREEFSHAEAAHEDVEMGTVGEGLDVEA